MGNSGVGLNANTFSDSEWDTPLVGQNVEADGAVRIDVRVVYFRGEREFRRLERVVCRELDCQEEHAPLIWTVPL